MLFNSYAFLAGFLPITLAGYFLFGRLGKTAGAAWLTAASLFFYAWWDYRYLPLLLASICANYLAGGFIARHPGSSAGRRMLGLALITNLALLGYYKYADFFLSSASGLLGGDWTTLGIVLPIGISFFTFTQIAFLADAYAGKVSECRFIYYTLFVTYFPHLIAGPVLHHKEMMPQFDEDRNYRPVAAHFAIGLSIFAIGLAKKVLIADNLAGYAAPAFDPRADAPSLFLAWGGVLAYTFELYFDFSGYSDMAIGLSRLFGVHLPLNFDSPYKAHNIADFWRRWHMSLSRFLRDYLYIPLGGNRCEIRRCQLNLMITMVLGGLWHGAGWNFAIWGALHGGFLIVHQIWQALCGPLLRWIPLRLPPRLGQALSVATTFLCVVFAWVYFRAPDLATAHRLIAGMLGASGVGLPEPVMTQLGPLGLLLAKIGVVSYLGGGANFVETWLWVMASALMAFFAANTQEIIGHIDTALSHRPVLQTGRQARRRDAMAVGLLFAFGVLALSRPTEFLYFQF